MGVDTRFDIDALADIQQRLVGTEKSIDTAVGRQDIEGRTRCGKVYIFKLGQHGRYDHRSRLKTLRSSSFCRGRFYRVQTEFMGFDRGNYWESARGLAVPEKPLLRGWR